MAIEIVIKEYRKKYIFDVGTLRKYGDRYKITYQSHQLNKGMTISKNGKGQTNDEKLDCNLRRAKCKIEEYALCNDWGYFATLTLNKDKQDRYDIKGYIRDLGKMINNMNRYREVKITYLLIPERHKDGAWHMHGFFNGLTESDLIKAKKGSRKRDVYNWVAYGERFGFNDLERIEDKGKATNYIKKYISKDMARSIKEINAKTYYCSKGLKVSETIKKGTVSTKYNPGYVKMNVDKTPIYSCQWLPIGTNEEEATSYINGITKCGIWQYDEENPFNEAEKLPSDQIQDWVT